MSDTTLDVLIVRIADRDLAIPVARVREVLRAVALSPVPEPDDRVEGLLNLRGRAVPVLALGRRIGLPAGPLSPDDNLVLVEGPDDRLVAVRSERTCELRSVTRTTSSATSVLAGMVRLDDRLVGLVDVERLAVDATPTEAPG